MTPSNTPLKITKGLDMVFDRTLEQFFNIKLFEIIANEKLLFSTLFPTAELLFEKLYTQISERKLSRGSL